MHLIELVFRLGLGIDRLQASFLSLAKPIIAVVAQRGELVIAHAHMVEPLAIRILPSLEVGSRKLNAVLRLRLVGVLEDLDIVQPQRVVQLNGQGSDTIVLAFWALVALIEPNLAVRDDQALAKKLIVLRGTLHYISFFFV